MISSLTGWVLRHRLLVVGVWLALTVGGVMATSSLGGALSQQFSVPGSAVRTSAEIAHRFGSGGQVAPLVPVVTISGGDLSRPALARQAQAAFTRVANAEPGSRLASYATTGDRAFLAADHRTEYALVFPAPGRSGQLDPALIAAARRAVAGATVAGATVHVTGLDALRTAGTSGGGNGVMAEAMLGAGGALLVLAFVFASFVAVVPLLTAGVAIMTTLLVIRGLAAVSTVSLHRAVPDRPDRAWGGDRLFAAGDRPLA